jgi:tyrosine-protein kinase Etk/Wzc
MTTEHHSASPVYTESASEAEPDDEMSLVDLVIVLAKRKLMIVGVTVAAAIVSIVYTLLQPDIYTAATRVLPPQQSQSAVAGLLGQLGGLGGMAGGSLGIKNPNDLYVAMLKSRTIADNIISRFDLRALYKTSTSSATRAALAGNSTITAGKDGLITIEFDDYQPQRAAAIANAYVAELDKLTQTLAVTEAARRRLFFERQLQQAKTGLMQAEIAARTALANAGVAMVGEQGKSIIESTARLRAQATAKEVQIAAMKGYASDRNPELFQAQQELAAIRLQLAKLEGATARGGGVESGKGDVQGMKSASLLRDMKYNEALFELLAKQYELAKIEEAKDAAIVQVVDPAIPPDRKSKPKRSEVVIAFTLVSAVLAVVLAFVREAIGRARRDPVKSARLDALRRYLSVSGARAK